MPSLLRRLERIDSLLVDLHKKIMRAPSMGAKLDGYGGFGPGFDFCRIYLAISVLVWHGWMLVAGRPMLDTYTEIPGLWLLKYSVLPMFFALSGFLITASAQRLSCGNFLVNRALRIIPALAVEIILSVCILGAIFTSLPLSEYFSDPLTYKYFLNIIGYVQFVLPGVFFENPFYYVNGSLWTVPLEIACYVLMIIAILTRMTGKSLFLFLIATAYPIIWFLYMLFFNEYERAGASGYVLNLFFNYSGVGLIPCFLIGAAMYGARYRIPHSPILFGICLTILILVGFASQNDYINDPRINILIDPLMTYVVIYLGLCRLPKLPFYSRGDYSYGMYLYAYPIQQSLIHLWPSISLPVHWLLTIILVSGFAAFSWHCIEKPILGLRKNLSFVSRRRLS